MEVEVKKIYLGNVSVRDYVVNKAKGRKEKLVIRHGDEVMTIPYEKLESGLVDTHTQRSKFNNKTYTLVDFKWKPDKKAKPEAEGQESLI